MYLQFLILGIGLTLLWGGAELLIRNSSILARTLGIRPLIIGLSVVSFGTSVPEFVVSLVAAVQGTMGIALGNIIGSNIANICLILGVGAVITHLQVKKNWVYKEVPFMLAATFIFILFIRTGYLLNRFEGFILIVVLFLFLTYLYLSTLRQIQEFAHGGNDSPQASLRKKIEYGILSLVGMIILILGSKLTVSGGTNLAYAFGVSDTVIGLTIIAFGTSLPELATTIIGCLKNETDIVVGNVVGSNIFNLLFIGGTVSLIKPVPVARELFGLEIFFLIFASLIIWPVMRLHWNIHRIEGVILIITYLCFAGLTFFYS